MSTPFRLSKGLSDRVVYFPPRQEVLDTLIHIDADAVWPPLEVWVIRWMKRKTFTVRAFA